jgi:hypothetical protein
LKQKRLERDLHHAFMTPTLLQVLANQWLLLPQSHHSIKEERSQRNGATTAQNLAIASKHRATSAKPPDQPGEKRGRCVGERITLKLQAETKPHNESSVFDSLCVLTATKDETAETASIHNHLYHGNSWVMQESQSQPYIRVTIKAHADDYESIDLTQRHQSQTIEHTALVIPAAKSALLELKLYNPWSTNRLSYTITDENKSSPW